MDQALQMFHNNRDVFIELGIRQHFDIPKFHFTGHYRFFLEMYGTADNFNTENTERLHIDMAKNAYAASNRKDEYPQMTAWLDRQEKIRQHDKHIHRRLTRMASGPVCHVQKPLPSLIPQRRLHMTKHPTLRAVPLNKLRTNYGTTLFADALRRFVAQYQHPTAAPAYVKALAPTIHIPAYSFPVYHRLKFVSYDVYRQNPLWESVVDSLHVEPARRDKYNKVVPGRFDTAMIRVAQIPGDEYGVEGECSGQPLLS